MTSTTDPRRARLVRLLHVGKSKIGLDDGSYRALLAGVSGKASSTELSVSELEAVLDAMRRLGFVPSGSAPGSSLEVGARTAGGATGRQLRYIKGLWALASRAKSEEALRALVRRVGGVEDLRFLDKWSATKIIQALRDIAVKAGYDPDGPRRERR